MIIAPLSYNGIEGFFISINSSFIDNTSSLYNIKYELMFLIER
ncbi:MAG: hypothetical protein K0Q73_8306 [Paenibacillus sp.]|jgi:hypothetical protein|nr:hypothetical protein [Paenibacillus sp.]